MIADKEQLIFWQFIRGDLPSKDFEQFVYNNPDLENIVGSDLYLELISTNFIVTREVFDLKDKLKRFMRKNLPLSCECIACPDEYVLAMGSEEWEHIEQSFQEVKKHAPSKRSLCQCSKCSQYWLMAYNTLALDVDYLKRLNNLDAENIIINDEWLKYFEKLEELITLARGNGYYMTDVDEFEWSYYVEELKKERPSITSFEIASLLGATEEQIIDILNKLSL